MNQSLLQPLSLYFHIPFCVHRCAYCDFNTYAGQEDSIPAYVRSLCREIQTVSESFSQKLSAHTIFFGGGTASLLTARQFESILDSIHSSFHLTPDEEISLEANPGTCSPEYLKDLRAMGFNRISFGVQSAHPEELRLLERIHNYKDVIDAVKWSRLAGFENINLDLIYGLPEQAMERWESTLALITGLHPEHLSLYSLTFEHGTPFGHWADRGLLPMPDPDLTAEMYELAWERLDAAGYGNYEISNWSIPGYPCQHNLQYWRNRPYLGLGAGAHGYAGGVRYSNVLRVKTYINRLEEQNRTDLPFPLTPATVSHHWNSMREDMQETMLTGLRLTQEGVSEASFRERYSVEILEVFGGEIKELTRLGLLEWVDHEPVRQISGRLLRLSKRGILLGNQVFMRFVGE